MLVCRWCDKVWTATECQGVVGWADNGRNRLRVLSQCWKMQPKPYKEETARSIFEETAINITTEGRKHQGAAIGSTSYLKHYVNGRKRNRPSQITTVHKLNMSCWRCQWEQEAYATKSESSSSLIVCIFGSYLWSISPTNRITSAWATR